MLNNPIVAVGIDNTGAIHVTKAGIEMLLEKSNMAQRVETVIDGVSAVRIDGLKELVDASFTRAHLVRKGMRALVGIGVGLGTVKLFKPSLARKIQFSTMITTAVCEQGLLTAALWHRHVDDSWKPDIERALSTEIRRYKWKMEGDDEGLLLQVGMVAAGVLQQNITLDGLLNEEELFN